MGFEIAITRERYFKAWMPEERPALITLDELQDLATQFPELCVKVKDVPPEIWWCSESPKCEFFLGEFVVYPGNERWEASSSIKQKFSWVKDDIRIMQKMLDLANKLGGVLVDDDDNVYLPNGELYEVIYEKNCSLKGPRFRFSRRWNGHIPKTG